jgi:hypothetical protein
MPEERSVKFFNSILPPQEKNLLKSQEIDGWCWKWSEENGRQRMEKKR